MRQNNYLNLVCKTFSVTLMLLLLCTLPLKARSVNKYVRPISGTEFKINGKIINIYKEYEKQQKAYKVLLDKNLPQNFIKSENQFRHLYIEQPKWKGTYKIAKLKNFYTICFNETKDKLGIIYYKNNAKYMYEFALIDNKWIPRASENETACMRNEIMKISTDYTIIPTNKDEQKNIKNLTDLGYSYNVAQMQVRKLYREMLVDSRLGKKHSGYESFQIIGLDYDNHAILIANHYVGNFAEAYGKIYGLPNVLKKYNDFWAVQ